ncbi:MAG: C4-dicarboxylate ABC transporter permease [Rhodospirillaceae bacterium]|nr:C4-dicarboxylate ABC transporter permease [Rhodospirillaceae bacterium]
MSIATLIKNTIDRLEEGFMALALAFMTLLTFTQVVLREFGAGWVWSLEATTYTFAWMVLVGMSYGVRTKSHIAVDLFARKLPPHIRRIVALIAVGLCLLYCGFMFYGGSIFVDRLMTLGNNARDIPLPRWVLTGIMPIAFTLLAYRFIELAWAINKGTETGLTADHGAANRNEE